MTCEIADAVTNLQLELQQSYALRTDVQAVAVQITSQSSNRSSSAASSSSLFHNHSQWDGDGTESVEEGTIGAWRVKNAEQARAVLRSDLEQCIQDLRSELVHGETSLRSVCNGFESKVDREIGRLEQGHKDVVEKVNRLTAKMADEQTEVAAA
eukprot:COSAG02_NODE_22832_length_739_cov_0.948438_1_plen_153_part_10